MRLNGAITQYLNVDPTLRLHHDPGLLKVYYSYLTNDWNFSNFIMYEKFQAFLL